MNCRSCGHELKHIFLNLQNAPPSNSFLDKMQLTKMEPAFPLCVYVCEKCFLVQIDEYALSENIFNAGYVYFSSFSEEFVRHAKCYVDHITRLLKLNEDSLVYEAASNDGYLLQFFLERNIPCCGIEPSESVAKMALEKGIPTEIKFFNASNASLLAEKKGYADLFIGNNVMAHVPNLNDFIAGIKIILKPDGVATLEFPHLLKLIERNEFDTIYHEHYSYFSLLAVRSAFLRHGLNIYHVEKLAVHGGSLRIYVAHLSSSTHLIKPSVAEILCQERAMNLDQLSSYSGFQPKIEKLCLDFIDFLVQEKKKGAKIIGYGAAAKGNTLLNYCGIKSYLIEFVADITPAKQGKFLPGSHIPVYSEEAILEYKPDYIIILPWNWENAILQRLEYVREWGAKFVTAIPQLKIH